MKRLLAGILCLEMCIRDRANIRRKIEKNPADPKYIFTETGVGYRMIESD